jgi:hypothetical protein
MRRTNLSTLSASDPTHRSADLGLARRALDAIGGVSSGRVGAVADARDADVMLFAHWNVKARLGSTVSDAFRAVATPLETSPSGLLAFRGAAIEQALGAPPRVATRADEFLERL